MSLLQRACYGLKKLNFASVLKWTHIIFASCFALSLEFGACDDDTTKVIYRGILHRFKATSDSAAFIWSVQCNGNPNLSCHGTKILWYADGFSNLEWQQHLWNIISCWSAYLPHCLFIITVVKLSLYAWMCNQPLVLYCLAL